MRLLTNKLHSLPPTPIVLNKLNLMDTCIAWGKEGFGEAAIFLCSNTSSHRLFRFTLTFVKTFTIVEIEPKDFQIAEYPHVDSAKD